VIVKQRNEEKKQRNEEQQQKRKFQTMRINVEHLLPISIVIGIFILALFCLACSMNPREILDCSIFRCCCSRRCRRRMRRRRGVRNGGSNDIDDEDEDDDNNNHHQNPAARTYETLNEFIFEAEDEERAGFVEFNDIQTETSVQNVFPDLLGGTTASGGGGALSITPWGYSSSSAAAATAAATARAALAEGGGSGGGDGATTKRETHAASGNGPLNEPLL
jgi:hypothetical protein